MPEVGAPNGELSAHDVKLALLIAHRYYNQDHSKVAIAAELGMSRFKVARLLDRARAEGLVTVTIAEPAAVDQNMSKRLEAHLGVKRVLVADPVDPTSTLTAVAAVAAAYLRREVTAGSTVGLAWSRALRTLPAQLVGAPPCTIVQLCGVLAPAHPEIHNVELVRQAAEACGGDAVTFYAPFVLPDATTARILREEPGIADALRRCDHLSTAVIAVGQWKPGASTVFDALGPDEAEVFTRRGAVAESSGLLFDVNGKVLRAGLQKRLVAVTEAQLRNTPDVLALASEPERVTAIRAIIRSGIVTTLITHRAVAERLLSEEGLTAPTG